MNSKIKHTSVLLFLFLITAQMTSQSINDGSHLNNVTSEQVPIKYRYDSGELDGVYYATYSVFEGKKNIITFKISNDVLARIITISMKDEISKKDSTFKVTYTEEGGLFLMNGDQNSKSIDNTTFYDLLLSFDPMKIEVKLHTIGTASFNKGYYRLDEVSNRWIKEHNSRINTTWEESIRSDERKKGELIFNQRSDSIKSNIEIQYQEENQNIIADYITSIQKLYSLPTDPAPYIEVVNLTLSKMVDTLPEVNFELEQIFSVFIDTEGRVTKVLLSKRTSDKTASAFEDQIIKNLMLITFPPNNNSFNGVKFTSNAIFDYELRISSSCHEDKWRCLNTGQIENYDDHNLILPDYEIAFRKLYPELTHGIYRALICRIKWNEFNLDKVKRIWSI